MFEKTLSDVIRGIRAHKTKEDAFISACLNEARSEIRRDDLDIKARALQKILYLHMMGHDMAWASFHVVEVMSAPKFQYKRLGYLAAVNSFKPDTEVLMLCTNLMKKDLSSNNYLEVSLALSGLAVIATPELARVLLPDLLAMLNHSRSYIRKRVVLLMYRVFLKYPDALRQAFPRLRDKLEDHDGGVVSAAVNVICELSNTNPKNYILLAPQLYGLLTSSSNNWMLIKIVKLFGLLTPEEPRLARKLVQPLTNLIQSTHAMSLLYECIHTVFTGGFLAGGSEPPGTELNQLATLCVTKLRTFVEDSDPNLKYLGLNLLLKLLPVNPKAVSEYRETILGCLNDPDVSIRLRALDIVTSLVTVKNIQDLIRRLLVHLMPLATSAPPSPAVGNRGSPKRPPLVLDLAYRSQVVHLIVEICKRDSYEMVTDFEWYADVIVDLARFAGVDVGWLLSGQLIDVAVRVKGVRRYLVSLMASILTDTKIFEAAGSTASNVDVLHGAAWIVGEYGSLLDSPLAALRSLVYPVNLAALSPAIQAVHVHAMLKVLSAWASRLEMVRITDGEWKATLKWIQDGLVAWEGVSDLEVCERVATFSSLLRMVHQSPSNLDPASPFQPSPLLRSLVQLFQGDLNPVAKSAQRRVATPEGLTLDERIVAPPDRRDASVASIASLAELDREDAWEDAQRGKKGKKRKTKATAEPPGAGERSQSEPRRKADPFYIGTPDESGTTKGARTSPDPIDDIENIPVVKLDFDSSKFGEIRVEQPDEPRSLRKKPRKPEASEPGPEVLRSEESPYSSGSAPQKTKRKLTAEQLSLGGVALTEEDMKSSRTPYNPSALPPRADIAEEVSKKGKSKDSRKPKKKKKAAPADEEVPIDGDGYERIAEPPTTGTANPPSPEDVGAFFLDPVLDKPPDLPFTFHRGYTVKVSWVDGVDLFAEAAGVAVVQRDGAGALLWGRTDAGRRVAASVRKSEAGDGGGCGLAVSLRADDKEVLEAVVEKVERRLHS